MSKIDELVERLGLAPHPEGGFYRETWRSAADDGSGRALATSILFLLPQGVTSRWHRVDAEELWIHQAGDPLSLRTSRDGNTPTTHRLGTGDQVVVPAHAWQDARSLGAWTLVACVVAPGFQFEGFEMAPDGWEPNGAAPHGGEHPGA